MKKATKKKPSSEESKIVLMMTMTLDGYLAGTKNELDWMGSALYSDPEEIKDNLDILKTFEKGIIGYPALAGMVPYWKHVEEDPKASENEKAIAKIVNNYHAYAFSKKEETAPTEKAEIIIVKNDADIIEAVKSIKAKNSKNMGVAGGVRTAQTLSKLNLIDEYILTIYPVVIGSGKPLFVAKTNLELLSSKNYQNGIIRSRYRPV